jgi:tetratricopeptide (TPR) repeat protein
VLILLVLLAAFCAGFHTVADYDMGWQMATGRYVVQHHEIPRTDVLSFTSAGEPWAYPPFAGVLFYLIYRALGYAGLTWFCAFACLSVVAYLVRRRDMGSVVLAMLAVQSIAARTSPRADLFSTVFFAIFLGELWAYYRGAPARPWLLPILMLFWVNLHPGFIAGLGVMGAYIFLELTDLPFADHRSAVLLRLKKIWPWLIACGVATLLNPWGPRIYVSSLTLSGLAAPSQGKLNSSTFIGEFQGVPISAHLLRQLIDVRHMENGFTWLLLVAVILIALFLWRRQLGPAVITLVALSLGLAHARYMALFAITIVTLGGVIFSELFTVISSAEPEKRENSQFRVPAPVAVLAGIMFCFIVLLQITDFVSSRRYIVFASDWRFGAGASSWFPSRAADFIKREQLPRNVFTEYALGGYAAWALGPEYPDFIDGRGDRLSPDLVIEQRKLYSENPDSPAWQAFADRWNLNVLLVATSEYRGLQKMDPSGFCQSTTWRPVYMDDVSLVYVRNTPQNRPWIDRLEINCQTQALAPPGHASGSTLYDFYLNSGALFFELHRDRESEVALQRASSLYPEDPNAHLLLAYLYQRQQRYREAEQEYRASINLNENSEALFSLGCLYAYQGQNAEALEAIQTAAKQSTQPLRMYMTLAKLQLELNQPSAALQAFASAEKSSPYRNGGEALAPELYAEIAEGKSEAHRRLGDSNAAIAFQQEATRRTPSVAARWNRLADIYQASGQMQLAAEARQRAAELTASQSAP